ncbi:uncharacterized protein JCM15063_006083 [Sporobolomyces koalae]|uniref:uncharacterized protein n=1 Tax=Sporobolomyces koalae TaxID=500713 RepID=UPI00317304B2
MSAFVVDMHRSSFDDPLVPYDDQRPPDYAIVPEATKEVPIPVQPRPRLPAPLDVIGYSDELLRVSQDISNLETALNDVEQLQREPEPTEEARVATSRRMQTIGSLVESIVPAMRSLTSLLPLLKPAPGSFLVPAQETRDLQRRTFQCATALDAALVRIDEIVGKGSGSVLGATIASARAPSSKIGRRSSAHSIDLPEQLAVAQLGRARERAGDATFLTTLEAPPSPTNAHTVDMRGERKPDRPREEQHVANPQRLRLLTICFVVALVAAIVVGVAVVVTRHHEARESDSAGGVGYTTTFVNHMPAHPTLSP